MRQVERPLVFASRVEANDSELIVDVVGATTIASDLAGIQNGTDPSRELVIDVAVQMRDQVLVGIAVQVRDRDLVDAAAAKAVSSLAGDDRVQLHERSVFEEIEARAAVVDVAGAAALAAEASYVPRRTRKARPHVVRTGHGNVLKTPRIAAHAL
ncbi:MAG: hypothetical protein JO036_00965 [Candidatus Eremiobacteraeota bacterium]|nr:hypothetical protein [Candidatus Eremiobacteraeota bacterium]